MTTATPTLTEAIEGTIQAYLDGVHTSMPGKIVSYDSSTQTASIQPSLKGAYVDENSQRKVENLPIINRVPIVFLRSSSGHADTIPLSSGDRVLLLFTEASIDKWISVGGGIVDPGDDRRFAIADAIAIPGLYPAKDATDQVHSSDRVLSGGLRLGGKDATDAVIKGTSYISDESAFLTALTAWMLATKAALISIPAFADPAKATYITATTTVEAAVTAFQTNGSLDLSSKVKVE